MKVTLKSLAAELKVDPSLVSRVLRGDPEVRVSDEKRDLIKKTAAQRGYRPNRLARSLKASSTRVIALLTPDVTNPFHSFLFKGVERVAQDAGYNVILCNTPDLAHGYEKTLELLTQGMVDGVLVASARLPDPRLEELRRLKIPFLVLNRPSGYESDNWVGPDDFQTGLTGAQHFIERGHRRVTMLLGDPGLGNMQERERGFVQAMENAGARRPQYQIIRHVDTKAKGLQTAMQLFSLPEGQRPTAIFTPHTLLTEALIEAAIRTGRRLPDDIDVLGYCVDLNPVLPSILMPAEDLGAEAMKLFLQVLQFERNNKAPIRVKFEPRIISPLQLS